MGIDPHPSVRVESRGTKRNRVWSTERKMLMTSGGWRRFRADAPTVLALGVLSVLTVDARQGGAVSRFERRTLRAPAPAPSFWKIVAQLGEAPAAALMTASATLMAAASSRGRWWQPMLSVVGGGLVRSVLCRTLQRERPPRQ